MIPETHSMHEVLSMNNSSFFIPPFQRAYAWGQHEIDRYFDDIRKVIESERDSTVTDKLEHFFGVLVFKPVDQGFAIQEVVVDGQQRLTTTLLLLIALRDSEADENNREQIEKLYLKNDSSSFGDKIKLKQVTSDWEAYKALINRTEHISGRITQGYSTFISKIASSDFTTMEYITALKRINVACIFLDERPYKGEDPQIIFETLNSLGKPLSLADLIRNYILLGMNTTDQTDIFEKVWHPEIEELLEPRSSHFFRDYLQYKESRSFKVVNDGNTKELYAQFTDYIVSKYASNTQAFISDIRRYVPWYKWIIDFDYPKPVSRNSDNNIIIKELLRNIFHDLTSDSFKPLVLGLLEFHQDGFTGDKLSDEQLIAALDVIRTYLVRRRVLKITQGENKDIPKLCDFIKGNIELLSDARLGLLRLLCSGTYNLRMPNDVEISEALKRIDFYNGVSKYRKLILGKIEERISKVAIDFRDKSVTVEHVMPQSIEKNKSWQKELGSSWEQIHKAFLHNIGNLILTEFNSEMGNKSLSEKRKQLMSSNLQYRKDVIPLGAWGKPEMIAHQKEMIERFLITFPLPTNMQTSENWASDTGMQTVDTVTPYEEELISSVLGRKPRNVSIEGEVTDTKTWQDVYLIFLRWLKDVHPMVYGKILNTTENSIDSKYPPVADRGYIEELGGASSRDIDSKFKRLSDGMVFSKVVGENDKKQDYAFVNQSAVNIMKRIKLIQELAGMDEESVVVELK
ncbi:MAG: DUF262 domain-containing HNH endonuclease family protein [Clostridiales Family XIII bacterium]|jgi:uncharacterized protein with ParB-like and HNH nuclease domain|nr:DUF262 domain-containing HNH endonuclease family protein [Clostridiales Family XIII bacterium]